MNITVTKTTLTLHLDATRMAQVLTQMADHMESNEPPPNHWDEDKRDCEYAALAHELGAAAATFMKKILMHMND